jgi:hypothetical protein
MRTICSDDTMMQRKRRASDPQWACSSPVRAEGRHRQVIEQSKCPAVGLQSVLCAKSTASAPPCTSPWYLALQTKQLLLCVLSTHAHKGGLRGWRLEAPVRGASACPSRPPPARSLATTKTHSSLLRCLHISFLLFLSQTPLSSTQTQTACNDRACVTSRGAGSRTAGFWDTAHFYLAPPRVSWSTAAGPLGPPGYPWGPSVRIVTYELGLRRMKYEIAPYAKEAHKVQFFWIRTLESNRALRSNGIGLFRGLGLLGPNRIGLLLGLGLLDPRPVGLWFGLGLLVCSGLEIRGRASRHLSAGIGLGKEQPPPQGGRGRRS